MFVTEKYLNGQNFFSEISNLLFVFLQFVEQYNYGALVIVSMIAIK